MLSFSREFWIAKGWLKPTDRIYAPHEHPVMSVESVKKYKAALIKQGLLVEEKSAIQIASPAGKIRVVSRAR